MKNKNDDFLAPVYKGDKVKVVKRKKRKTKKGIFRKVYEQIPSTRAMMFTCGIWLVFIVNKQLMLMNGATLFSAHVSSMLISLGLMWVASEIDGKGLEGLQ